MAVSSGFRVQGSGFDAPSAEPPISLGAPVAGGHHLLVDFWVAEAEPLRHVETWQERLPEACRAAGATVLGARFHQFEPDGVTGIVLLAESHASVHTWPEAGLVTLDVFTCGALDTAAIVGAVRRWLAPVRERVTAVARGDVAQLGAPLARTSETSQTTSPSWTEPAPGSNRGGDRGGGSPGLQAAMSTTPCPPPPPRRGDATSPAELDSDPLAIDIDLPHLGTEASGLGGADPDPLA